MPAESQRAESQRGTVTRYLAYLSHAFTIAVREWQWLESNPVKLEREFLGEALDALTRLGSESRELLVLQETMGPDRDQLAEHLGALRIVERDGHLPVPLAEPAVESQITLMMAPSPIKAEGLDPSQDPFAEPLESDLAEFAEDPPVGFGVPLGHSTGVLLAVEWA